MAITLGAHTELQTLEGEGGGDDITGVAIWFCDFLAVKWLSAHTLEVKGYSSVVFCDCCR